MPAPIAPSATGLRKRPGSPRGSWPRSRDVPPADVVEPAVVRLAHDGIDRPDFLVSREAERQSDGGVGRGPTARVLVRMIGVFDRAELFHLSHAGELAVCVGDRDPAGTLSWKISPPWGGWPSRPSEVSFPSMRVTWPTLTPATSVMALSGPGRQRPGRDPRSRARGARAPGYECAETATRALSRGIARVGMMRGV